MGIESMLVCVMWLAAFGFKDVVNILEMGVPCLVGQITEILE